MRKLFVTIATWDQNRYYLTGITSQVIECKADRVDDVVYNISSNYSQERYDVAISIIE